MMESSDDKIRNNKSTKVKGVRYSPCKHNAFMTAVSQGRIDKVREIINSRGPCYAEEWKGGYSLLRTALEKKHTEVAKILLTSGSEVNKYKHPCNTPLHFAILNGDSEIVQMILDRGANIEARNKHRDTPLQIAVRKMQMKIIVMLLNHGANIDAAEKSKMTPLHIAIENNSKEIITFLLRRGANVNGKGNNVRTSGRATADTRNCCTPLQLAVMRDNEEITELLLSKGADVHASGDDDVTPIQFATRRGYLKVIECLLKYGADVHSPPWIGQTPLEVAVRNGDSKMVKLFLERGAYVNAKDKTDRAILHLAVERGNAIIVELLLEFGASADAIDVYGSTPLHIASERGHKDVVKALIEHGADVTIKSEGYYTALHIVMGSIGLIHYDNYGFGYNFNPNYHHDHEIFNYIHIAETLRNHMIKIRVANLYAAHDDQLFNFPVISDLVISSPDDESYDSDDNYPDAIYLNSIHVYGRDRNGNRLTRNGFRRKCEKEIAIMKSEMFVNTCVTFYDILIKNISQLAMYAKNESIVEAFRSEDYKEKFPMYGSMISNNFKKGEKRKELLEQGNKVLDILFNDFSELRRRGCTEIILNYLNGDDFRGLIEAGRPYVQVNEECSCTRYYDC